MSHVKSPVRSGGARKNKSSLRNRTGSLPEKERRFPRGETDKLQPKILGMCTKIPNLAKSCEVPMSSLVKSESKTGSVIEQLVCQPY